MRASRWVLAAGLWLPAAAFAEEAPRVQLQELEGRIEVRPSPGKLGADWKSELPYVSFGSEVQVVDGRAVFETENFARIEGEKGDAFRVQPFLTMDNTKGVRVSATAGAVIVRMEEARVLLAPGGSVAIYGADDGGRLEVMSEPVGLYEGTVLREGEKLSLNLESGSLQPGDLLSLLAPGREGFASAPISVGELELTETGAGRNRVVVARAGQVPSDLRLAPAPIARPGTGAEPTQIPPGTPEPAPDSLPDEPAHWPGTDGYPMDRRLSTQLLPE